MFICKMDALRSHYSPLTTLSFSNDKERIYSGDASGHIYPLLAWWKAHSDALLGVEEFSPYIVTFVLLHVCCDLRLKPWEG